MTTKRPLILVVLTLLVVAAASSGVTWSISRVNRPSHSTAHVAECLQGRLQVAIEQGGGFIAHYASGYTFLIVNTGATSCELRGYPHEVVLSTQTGEIVKVSIAHRRTSLYAQPRVRRVVLQPGGVASFAMSYTNRYAVMPTAETSTCRAMLVDMRLPARAANLFSFEFAVSIDVCAVGRSIDVTPIEGRTVPEA